MKTKRYLIKKSPDGMAVVLEKERGRSAHIHAVNLPEGSTDFMAGAASVFDLGATRISLPKFGSQFTDRRALHEDFMSIGRDMKDVLGEQLSFLEG